MTRAVLIGLLVTSAALCQPRFVRVRPEVMEWRLKEWLAPKIPRSSARIEGVVRLDAVIGADGKVLELTLISGHPLLVPHVIKAVKQWRYRPVTTNGKPVAVATVINVPVPPQPPPGFERSPTERRA